MDFTTFFSIVLFSILLIKWIIKRRQIFSTFEKLGIPGPKPSFFTGNLSEALAKPYFEVDLIEKYGPLYGFFHGVKPVLVVSDPEFLKIIQVKEAQIFHARNPVIPHSAVPSTIFDQSIALSGGPRWKENRDSISPGYTTSKFKMMSTVINNELDEAVAKISKFADNQQSFDLGKIYDSVFGNSSLQITFGIKMNAKDSEATKVLFDSLGRAFTSSYRNKENVISVCFPELESLLTYFKAGREMIRKFFNYGSLTNIPEMCDTAIRARMADKTADYTDVLQFMVNTIKRKMSSQSTRKSIEKSSYSEKLLMQEEDLVPNGLYLAVATYDLIRTISTYATYELAKSPRVQEKLRKEIFDVNGDKEHISYDSMSKMQYLDQVFNEAIRLHPTVPFFSNRISEEDYYYKGQLIPKGTTLYVPQIGMQRSAKFFPDPEAFIPERFDDKSKIDPYIYQPFGIGPRHCLGMRLTQYFGKVTLARMVQSFNLSVDPEAKEVRPELGFVVYRPKDPVCLLASPA